MELSEIILASVGALSTISAWVVMCAGVAQRLGCPGSSGSGGGTATSSTNNGGNAFEHSQTADSNLSVIFDTAGTRTGGSGATQTNYGGAGRYWEGCTSGNGGNNGSGGSNGTGTGSTGSALAGNTGKIS